MRINTYPLKYARVRLRRRCWRSRRVFETIKKKSGEGSFFYFFFSFIMALTRNLWMDKLFAERFLFSLACFATVTCLNCLSYCKVEGQQVICILNIFGQRQFRIIWPSQWTSRNSQNEQNHKSIPNNNNTLASHLSFFAKSRRRYKSLLSTPKQTRRSSRNSSATSYL